ncbi:MAG: asparaginase [Anaerolineales bacterium]
MDQSPYQPIYHFTRGEIVESIHYGAIAVVNARGDLIASHGDPETTTYLRSTAKPFQALPFIARGGDQKYHLTDQEIALICSSHSGTDEHVQVLGELQKKIGITEADLMCGTHPPYHKATRQQLEERGEEPTSNRHNCSGKHTGMIAHAKLINAPIDTYLEIDHPVQQNILQALSEMCDLEIEEVHLGTDGCSVPTFAVPLYNAALAWARLVDPGELSPETKKACQTITRSMTAHPFMVGGPDRLDTKLMDIAAGKVIAKSGAEAYQGIGIPPGALENGSQGVGITLKIADGDRGKRAKAPVVLEVLRQLTALSEDELEKLPEYHPRQTLINYRNIVVGHGEPSFKLEW